MMKLKILLLIGLLSNAAATEIKLWDSDMPGSGAQQSDAVENTEWMQSVTNPSLTLFLLENNETPVPLIVVCPGGGYSGLAWKKEGAEVAQWLNAIGLSAAVLKYRVPNNREGALKDARRAIRLAREKADEWTVDPARIGMLGFSAGGHLTAACSNSPDRPDFSVLVYPAYLFKKGGIELVDEINVDEQTPPAFIVQTQDDKKYYRSSLAYAAALDAQGVSVELHLFAKGGHGYGLRPTNHPVSQWPTLCEAWMRDTGILQE